MKLLVQAVLVARASALAEWRSRRVLASLLLLSVLAVLLIAFAVGGGESGVPETGTPVASGAGRAASAAFWLALGLACASAVHDWGAQSRPIGFACCQAGASQAAVFLGQSVALALVVLPVALVLAVASLSFLQAWSQARLLPLLVSITLGVVGLAGLSVAVGSRLAGARQGWSVLLFLVAGLPMLAAGASATEASLGSPSPGPGAAMLPLAASVGVAWSAGLWLSGHRMGGLG